MKIISEDSIVQKGHPVLSLNAIEIPLDEISSDAVVQLINKMKILLSAEKDGVALAAPQIGANVRLFIISPRAFKNLHPLEPLVYINPKIVKSSKKMEKLSEGCLSVRGVMGNVQRHSKISVTAYNERGQKFTRDGTGLLAQIFQHEIDHLNGVLFDSQAEDLEDYDHTEISA